MAQFLEQLGDGPLLLDLPVGVRICPRDPGLGARGQDHGQRNRLRQGWLFTEVRANRLAKCLRAPAATQRSVARS